MKSDCTGDLRLPCFFFLTCLLVALANPLRAQPPLAAPPATEPAPPPALGEILKLAFRKSLAEEFVDDSDWNLQAARWDGVHVRGLKVTPRKKLVNHGFWKRYRFQVIDPDQTLQLTIQQLPAAPDGSLPFAVEATLKARCDATFAFWTWGVKGVNGKGVADVVLAAHVELLTNPAWKFSLDSPLPDVDLHPRVGNVTLKLRDLKLHELGLLDGKAAQALGNSMQGVVNEILEKQSGKLREALNEQLQK